LAVADSYPVAYSASATDTQNVLGGAVTVATLFGADANCQSFTVAQATPVVTTDAPTKLSLDSTTN